MKKSTLFFMFFCIPTLLGMGKKGQGLVVYGFRGLVAGQNIDNKHLTKAYPKATICMITGTEWKNDFGQNSDTLIETKPNGKKIILHGSGFGATRILNILRRDKQLKVDAVILESPHVSINGAMHHGLEEKHPKIAGLPGAYYWLPYIAKLIANYSPSGVQPIKSIDEISKDVPITIINQSNADATELTNACALYYGLKKNGHKYVHLFNRNEVNDDQEGDFLKQFIGYHTSSEKKVGNYSLSYQPEPTSYKTHYDALMGREKNHELLFYFVPTAAFLSVSTAAFLSVCYVMRNHIGKILSYLKVFGRVS